MSIYDEETVREWAYDPERRMIDDADQDEDLTIGLKAGLADARRLRRTMDRKRRA